MPFASLSCAVPLAGLKRDWEERKRALSKADSPSSGGSPPRTVHWADIPRLVATSRSRQRLSPT